MAFSCIGKTLSLLNNCYMGIYYTLLSTSIAYLKYFMKMKKHIDAIITPQKECWRWNTSLQQGQFGGVSDIWAGEESLKEKVGECYNTGTGRESF